jgi:MFS family permease
VLGGPHPEASTQHISQSEPREPRVNKRFLFSFLLFMASSTISFGYMVVNVNPNIETFEVKFNLKGSEGATWIAIISTVNSVGAVCGVFSTSLIINKGRKRGVFAMHLIAILGGVITLVEDLYAIAIGRFIIGFGALGMSIVLAPKYIEETSPVKYKGTIGAFT